MPLFRACSVIIAWRGHCRARKGPYVLRSVSQRFSRDSSRNSTNVVMTEHILFATAERELSNSSFLLPSVLQAVCADMSRSFLARNVSQASQHLCPQSVQINKSSSSNSNSNSSSSSRSSSGNISSSIGSSSSSITTTKPSKPLPPPPPPPPPNNRRLTN